MPADAGVAAQLVHFARLLRAAGLRVGSGQIVLAARALERIELTDPADVYWTLHSLWVRDPRERPLFEQAFRLFWQERQRPHDILQQLITVPESGEHRQRALRRVAEAFAAQQPEAASAAADTASAPPPILWDVTLTHSERERLSSKDFEQMTAAEVQRAKQWIARLALRLEPWPSRRLRPAPHGKLLDLSATLRAAARSHGQGAPLRFRRRVEQPPPLLVLCDVSGSMERYARIFLHFMHALTQRARRGSVHSFVFGTRLTPITHSLRQRDVDLALAQIGQSANGWTGGTRIGACLTEFNQRWLRRVPLRRGIVLFISDGLDRDAGAEIGPALQRLRRSCRRLIWLNPLLRFAGFEPRAAGIRAILPQVDEHRPVHDLRSLEELCEALSAAGVFGARGGVPRGAEPGSAALAPGPVEQ